MKQVLVLFTIVLIPLLSFSQKTWDGDALDGLWETAANWNLDQLPISTDDVVINNGEAVTLSSDQTIASITITGTGSELNFDGSSNTLTINGNLSLSSSATLDNEGAISIEGNFTKSSSTLVNQSNSTFEFFGSTNTTIASVFDFENLNINKGSGFSASLTGTTRAYGTVSLTNGSLDLSDNYLDCRGNLSHFSAGLINGSVSSRLDVYGTSNFLLSPNENLDRFRVIGAGTVTIGSDIIANNFTNTGGKSLELNGFSLTSNNDFTFISGELKNGDIFINGTIDIRTIFRIRDIGILDVSNAGSIPLAINTSVDDLRLAGGVSIDLSGKTLTIQDNYSYTSGSIIGNSGSIIFNSPTISASTGLSGTFSSITLNSAATLNLPSGLTVTNLNSNAGTIDLSTNSITVTDITIGASGTYQSSGGTLTVNGDIAVTGSLSTTGSTTSFSGTTNNLSGPGTIQFHNVSISNSLIDGSSGFSLTGNWSNSGTFTPGSGDVTFNGTTQSISGTNTFNDFTVTNNSAVSNTGSLTLNGTFTPTTGSFNTGNDFTLVSTGVSGDARIADASSFGSITGTMTVQRFVDGTTGGEWRYLSSPLIGTTLDQWQSGIGVTGDFTDPSTSPTFPLIVNSQNTNPSVYTYDSRNTVWEAIGNTGNPVSSIAIDNGVGYSVFNFSESDVTISMTGTYPSNPSSDLNNQGDVFNLLGNPYPSPILWDDVQGGNSTRISTGLSIRTTPTTYATYPVGGPAGGSGAPAGWGGEILTGQSFWVSATSNAAVNYDENMKVVEGSGEFLRTEKRSMEYLQLKLYGNDQEDVAVIRFNPKSQFAFEGNYDAIKRYNGFYRQNLGRRTYMNFSSFNDQAEEVRYVVNTIPKSNTNQTVYLAIDDVEPGDYSIESIGLNLNGNNEYLLFDNYLVKSMDISLGSVYTFTVTDESDSYLDRFEVRLKNDKKEKIKKPLRFLFDLYPNPADDVITLMPSDQVINQVVNIRIIDMSGRTVIRQTNIDLLEIKLDISSLNSGPYIINVSNSEFNFTDRFLKK